jgi:hypothetical protein
MNIVWRKEISARSAKVIDGWAQSEKIHLGIREADVSVRQGLHARDGFGAVTPRAKCGVAVMVNDSRLSPQRLPDVNNLLCPVFLSLPPFPFPM